MSSFVVKVKAPVSDRMVFLARRSFSEGGSPSPPSAHFTNAMLLCVTEMNSRQEIDALVEALSEFGQ